MAYSAYTDWANEEKYLNNLINSGNSGQKIWAENQLGVLNSAKASYAPIQIDESIGSFQNALDIITAQSDKASARSLSYAKQQQEWSANQAAIANQFSAQEAAKNREWQQFMSNTAHQREIADLKAAGLNPVLSAMGGNGAAVTSGATASASLPSGSRADSDTSANGALVQLLGSMLSAQTAIQNQLVSAKTQEAVADKYNAMSNLTAEIAAAASMYGARQAAGASMYGADMQYSIRQDFPDNLAALINSVLTDRGTSAGSFGSQLIDKGSSVLKDKIGSKLGDVKDAINKLFGKKDHSYTGKGSGGSF